MKKEEANMIDMGVYSESEIKNELPLDADGNPERYIDSTWVFAKKFDGNGNLVKYKAEVSVKFRELITRKYIHLQPNKNWLEL